MTTVFDEIIKELEQERDHYVLPKRNVMMYNEGYIAATDKAIEILEKRKEERSD